MTADRRELLALSGAVLAGIPGCFGGEGRRDGSNGSVDRDDESESDDAGSVPGVDATFEIGFRQRGIDTEVWAALEDVVAESRTQGIAYRDGRLYVAGTEEGSHSTVYEFRRDGSHTGVAYSFGDGGHVNCLQWHDGDLWAMGFTAGEVYRVDLANRRVVGSFEYGGGTVMPDSPNNFVFVPTESGGARMVAAAEFGSTEAHVIDYEAAIRDGTAAGNVDATVDAGPFENTDGAHYRDGHAYFTNYAGSNARGAAFKVSLPAADRLRDGDRLAEDLEWYHPFETWSDAGHVQDLTYDRDEGGWYLVSDDDALTVYRGPERSHETVPRAWRAWDAVDSDRYGRVLDLASSAGTRSLPVFASPRSDVRVVVPFYDGGPIADGRVAVGVDDGSDVVGLGVDAAAQHGDATYCAWDGARSDTGVGRSSERWVLFGFDAAGEGIGLRISADGGETWERAGDATSVSAIAGVTLTGLEVDDARFAAGPVSIDVGR